MTYTNKSLWIEYLGSGLEEKFFFEVVSVALLQGDLESPWNGIEMAYTGQPRLLPVL